MSGLNERQLKAREGKMTGSRIATLMTGSPEDQYDLWLELTGDPSWKPKDYSKNFQVQLGAHTEPFHLNWIQQHTGDITRRGEVLGHKDPAFHWAAVTLDGWAADHRIPVEAKHVGGYEVAGIILERYAPQIQWTAFVAGTQEVIFSVITGNREPRPVFIGRDSAYIDELAKKAERFMQCVHELREPIPNPYAKPPLPIFTRMVDMTGNNLWATAASRWKQNLEAKKAYDFAAKEIKEATPPDAKEAYGHGIRVKRNKAGSLTIKLENEDAEQTED